MQCRKLSRIASFFVANRRESCREDYRNKSHEVLVDTGGLLELEHRQNTGTMHFKIFKEV
jgi:hypothetical protein